MGGAGYIGSVVTEEPVAGGHDVLVIDNLSKGTAMLTLNSSSRAM
jgi:UDP-glucose 4-epimerase